MAGTDPRFDAAAFRQNITFAMEMGLPNDPDDQPTFFFKRQKQWPSGTVLDQEGNALDPNVAPVYVNPAPVKVPCAVELETGTIEEISVGQFVSTRMIITLLDEHYDTVKNAIAVEHSGDRYKIRYERPKLGLFDVNVHQFVCTAEDES